MAADLFVWIDALWTKAQLDGTPPLYVMHRFLASERDYANAARILMREVKEPALVFRVWQGLLPVDRAAPRLAYPAAKKPPAAEALVARMMAAYGMSRAEAEDAFSLITTVGRALELYAALGVEPPEALAARVLDEPPPEREAAPRGLLGMIA